MPFFVGDYLGDTMDLSTEQHGAYLLLLFYYWKNRGPIVDDESTFCRVTGLMPDAWARHRRRIAKFFVVQNGLWFHKRVEQEMAKALNNKESRVNASGKAAWMRWHRDKAQGNEYASRIGDASPPSPECTSPPPRAREDASPDVVQGRELLSVDQVKAAVMTTGIPGEFVDHVYSSWCNRAGKDGAGVTVEIVGYVEHRWRREQVEWRLGTHRGQQQKGTNATRKTGPGSVNRNAGTANEGRKSDYSSVVRKANS